MKKKVREKNRKSKKSIKKKLKKWKSEKKWKTERKKGSGVCTTRIRRVYDKDQKVIPRRSGGYAKRIRRLYDKDHEVMFSNMNIEPSSIFVELLGIGKSGDWQK